MPQPSLTHRVRYTQFEHALRRLLATLLLCTLCQCQTAHFYTQALRGQKEILSKARPITDLLADPELDPKLRPRLELVQELRQFAHQYLQLPNHQQYDRYTDLKRKYAVWVVFAAPEFSLEPHTWRYPMLGRLAYRGFFTEPPAQALAAQLRDQGMDVFVSGVAAYSTLGWFSDPVLNTFIFQPDRDLAELLYHELTHQKIYFSGDTEFNEALATAVGRFGTQRWLQQTGRTQELTIHQRDTRILTDFLSELKQTRKQLIELYQQTNLSSNDKRIAKSRLIKQLRSRTQQLNRRYGGSLKIDKWFHQPVNNARLLSIATYYDLVPAFESLLARCQYDLPTFFQTLQPLRKQTKTQRRQFLEKFQPAPPSTSPN